MAKKEPLEKNLFYSRLQSYRLFKVCNRFSEENFVVGNCKINNNILSKYGWTTIKVRNINQVEININQAEIIKMVKKTVNEHQKKTCFETL